jgi:hypothetical protein
METEKRSPLGFTEQEIINELLRRQAIQDDRSIRWMNAALAVSLFFLTIQVVAVVVMVASIIAW